MGKEGTKEKLDIELEAPADFTSPEVLYQDLVKTIHKYHPSDDISMIEKAYKVAAEAHKDQKRKSGEPYIIHPLCVAIILADLEMDKETIAAGLLHDVVEDTVMTLDELTKEFGPEVAFLVDGVTKLTQLNWDKDKVEIQAENLRKMFLAMAKDIRVIIVKLADRLHNMRTGQYCRRSRRKKQGRPWRSMLLLQTVWDGACTCFMGTAKAINSYRNHAKLIAPSSSGITTTSSLSSAYSLPNFTTRRLWVSIGISISSKHLSHGTTTTPSI